MTNIYEVFDIARGTRLTKRDQVPGSTPFITAGSHKDGFKQKIQNTIGLTLYQNCITIDMFGFVKYRNYAFYCDDNIITLTPKEPIAENALVYMSLVLRQQTEGQYDYGRQCRLKNIKNFEVPDPEEIPAWVYEMDMPTFDDIGEAKIQKKVELPPINQWKTYTYQDLFTIQKVTGPKISEVKKTEGNVPYVSATSESNGIACYGDFKPTTKKNCLTVGHLGDCFYQNQDFAGSNVTVLIPKFELNQTLGLFLATLINANKYKYCYGRVIGIGRLKEETISLPVTSNGEPDWDLMEHYINSLPYSKYL